MFFKTNRSLNSSLTGRPVRLELAESDVDARTSMPGSVGSGSNTVIPSVPGHKQQDNTRNEICFDFVGVVSSFWRGLEDCYQLVQTSAREYLLRPVKDAAEFRFALK